MPVLFNRGDVFRGYVKLREGVTFSSYGTGAKPRIYGADENAAELEWKNEGNNIYSIPIDHKQDIGCIVFNEGEEWGYKKWLPGQTELLMDRDFTTILKTTNYIFTAIRAIRHSVGRI